MFACIFYEKKVVVISLQHMSGLNVDIGGTVKGSEGSVEGALGFRR